VGGGRDFLLGPIARKRATSLGLCYAGCMKLALALWFPAWRGRLNRNQICWAFPKPGELIEMAGTHVLEASDRAILNTLYRHAHDSGKLGDPGAEWEIPLSIVREAFSKHESSDRLRLWRQHPRRLQLRYRHHPAPQPNRAAGHQSAPCRHLHTVTSSLKARW
jgi:hypothetical protein